MVRSNELQKNEETIKKEAKALNYRLLKLRSKILANSLNISINNLHIFSMDNSF